MHAVPAAPDLAPLAASVRGTVIGPDHEDYDDARRVFDARFDRRPAVIVRPVDAADVARAVDFAREAGLPIAVRGGGHSVAGHSSADGAVLVDLVRLKGIEIDPDGRIGRAQGGVTAGEYMSAASEHGLLTPFGDTATVGLGGLTTGGGMGWLSRKLGLTIDSLLSVEVVTADGQIVTANEASHPELFWAVRGGGGNFGIVTAFEYRLYPISMITGGMLLLPATRDVLTGLVRHSMAAGDDLTVIAMVMRVPPVPFVAPEHHGSLGVLVMPVHLGDPETAQAELAPIRALAEPLADMLGPMPFPKMYELIPEDIMAVAGIATRAALLPGLDDALADALLARFGAPDAGAAMLQLRALGGAVSRVPAEATAYPHREAPLLVAALVPYLEPPQADAAVAVATDLYREMKPHAVGTYANFLEDEGEARLREAYPTATYERLAKVKREYDPRNLFRFNQNIAPA